MKDSKRKAHQHTAMLLCHSALLMLDSGPLKKTKQKNPPGSHGTGVHIHYPKSWFPRSKWLLCYQRIMKVTTTGELKRERELSQQELYVKQQQDNTHNLFYRFENLLIHNIL